MNKNSALINYKLLKWARESSGYELDAAAKRIGITVQKLKNCESDREKLTFNQLIKAANTYKRAIAIFYLNEIPDDFKIPDFRMLEEASIKKLPSKKIADLNYQIRRIYEFRENMITLDEILSENKLKSLEFNWNYIKSINITEDPEEIAKKIRNLLNVNKESKESWKRNEAYPLWRKLIEAKGTLVFQVPDLPLDVMRGFCIANSPYPIIAINSNDPQTAKCFTLLHEFCHIMLNESALCNPLKFSITQRDEKKIEIFCNYVAGAVLVPQSELSIHPLVINHGSSTIWDDKEILKIASSFYVSNDVILRRLLITNRTTQEFYSAKHNKWTETVKKPKKTNHAKIPYTKVVYSQQSHLYLNFIYTAMENNRISQFNAADYLNIKIDHLDKLKNNLIKGNGAISE